MLNFIIGFVFVALFLAVITGIGYLTHPFFVKYSLIDLYHPGDYFIFGVLGLIIAIVGAVFAVVIYGLGTVIINQLFV